MKGQNFISFLLASLIIVFYSCNNFVNCASFRMGNFKYHSDYLSSDVLVDREDSIQTEKIISSGKIVTGKIRWMSDCEYQTCYLGVNFPISDSDLNYLRSQCVTTKMVIVEKDFYVAKSTARGMTEPYIDTIKRVK